MGRIIAAALLLWCATAAAQNEQDALKLIQSGKLLYDSSELTAARAAFAKAHDLAPAAPNPLRWLAITDARLGRCDEGVKEADAFLAAVKPSDERRVELLSIRELCLRVLKLGGDLEAMKRKVDEVRATQLPLNRHVVLYEDGERTLVKWAVVLRLNEQRLPRWAPFGTMKPGGTPWIVEHGGSADFGEGIFVVVCVSNPADQGSWYYWSNFDNDVYKWVLNNKW